MAFRNRLKKLMCCCADRTSDKILKKRLKEHKYCGCRESSKQRSKMQTCDGDSRSLVDNEVIEALEYEFQAEELEVEDCLIEEAQVPFNHVLRSRLHPQSDIIVQGVLEDNAFRFAINLVVAHDTSDDIAFHFNPRLDQQYSARNSLLKGKWGHEEGNSQTKFPFQRGQPFFIEIFLTHAEFLVAVNGTHYCSYTYRTSVLNITGLQVLGKARLMRVQVSTSTQYPGPLPSDYQPSPYTFPLTVPGVSKNVTQITPVYGVLQGKLRENSKIEINGRVKILPISFYINLQEGTHLWPHPEIPLHVSIRFSQGGDHQVMLANSWLDEGWGMEDLSRKEFLFTPGSPFKVVIECNHDVFIVKLDEKIILTFKHRVPYNLVDTVHIQGDVFIYDISISL